MSANGLQTLEPSEICSRADEFVSCEIKSYLAYDKYKIGEKPDLMNILHVNRLRRIVCGNRCLLPEKDLARLSEKMNKIIN